LREFWLLFLGFLSFFFGLFILASCSGILGNWF
jgi:hypothetical protein